VTGVPLERLSTDTVVQMARAHGAQPPCTQCAPFKSAGWSSWPAGADESPLAAMGTLWLPDEPEPTLDEWRTPGLDAWSDLAPLSLQHYPANRCSVWACRACRKPFLRYTEYGGYYIDHRLRELHPDRLVD